MTDHKPLVSIDSINRRERRLEEIRAEAERHRQVQGFGVRPEGAPFPIASPEAGYYGIPLLKEPQWTWEIPLYFFVGGIAGASAIIGAAAHWSGKDLRISRDCRYLAAGGAMLSSALLISDLGRPERFLNMLRVFKPQSPMSVGAWVLAAFGSFAGASAFAQWLADFTEIRGIQVVGDAAEGFACLFGLPLATYTGVLLGATAIPVWNEHVTTLPIHFGMSGLNSAVGALELLGHDRSPALQALGLLAATVESAEGIRLETNTDRVAEPVKHGSSGWIIRAGGMLSGPIPLGLRLASLFVSREKRRRMRRMAAASSLAGSLITRYAWVHAGHISARDWRLPLEIDAPLEQPQLSRSDVPQSKTVAQPPKKAAGD
ncbi:Polysulphide reductase, NrfD [Candidatus Koribacter versatilis Ellin345]|uniref:Polysulphide reductase, NrfD n=1 Tax=Koribacter versatilis (strain Ellin345) TaxID=204669 RepID=Q1IPA6_KORVE|nr:NrfD/PsrC family molybdoenzyme membrane anchor subunit [Candidatus Koribacter versatilis]ABF41294.1 Polysulphide reductase, NrfD [Candidatus Koribacter versatilis Ellin345]